MNENWQHANLECDEWNNFVHYKKKGAEVAENFLKNSRTAWYGRSFLIRHGYFNIIRHEIRARSASISNTLHIVIAK